jgi:hypothetical protein
MKKLSQFLCSECAEVFEAEYPRYSTDPSGLVLCDVLCEPCADRREGEFERDRFDYEMENKQFGGTGR